MTPKKYLSQLIDIRKEIKCLDAKRRMINGDIQATEFKHDKSYSNEISRPPEDLVVQLENYEDLVTERQSEFVDLLGTISREIEEVSIRNFRLVLDYRYVQDLDWDPIAKKMDYTVRHLQDIHRNALKEFKKEHKNKDWQ